MKKARKIKGEYYMWEITGSPQYKFSFNTTDHIALVEYKGKTRAVLMTKANKFHSNQVINPGEARRLIGWLAHFINMVEPDSTTAAIARTKAKAKSIMREQDIVAKELGIYEAQP